MKFVISAVMAAAALISTPALAQSEKFSGPRVEARVGFDHVNADVNAGKNTGRIDANGVAYGIGVGYDIAVLPRIVAGATLAVDFPTSDGSFRSVKLDAKRDLSATARLGYVLGDSLLVYGQAGYSNQRYGRSYIGTSVEEGLRYGGGVELAVTRHTFVKADYITTEYNKGLATHRGLVSAGLRF